MAAPDCRLGVRAVDTLTGHVGDVYALAPPPKKNDSRRVLLSGGEDGARLWDLKARACVMQLGAGWLEEVATVALSPSDTNAAFAASDGAIRIFDVRKPDEAVSTVEINSDDINQVALNHKGEYLAAADDSGEVKVVEVWNRKPFKTLGRQHTNICSSVQFRAGKPWEVVTGGLDGCVVHWDFSRARCLAKINMTAAKTPEDAAEIDIGKQMCNPPLVHSLACSPDGSCIAAALGDGSVASVKQSPRNSEKWRARRGFVRAAAPTRPWVGGRGCGGARKVKGKAGTQTA